MTKGAKGVLTKRGSPPVTLAGLTRAASPLATHIFGEPHPFPAPLLPPKTTEFPAPILVYAWNQNDHRLGPNTLNWNVTLEHELRGNILYEDGRGHECPHRAIHFEGVVLGKL